VCRRTEQKIIRQRQSHHTSSSSAQVQPRRGLSVLIFQQRENKMKTNRSPSVQKVAQHLERAGANVKHCKAHQGSMRPYIFVRLQIADRLDDLTGWLAKAGLAGCNWLSPKHPQFEQEALKPYQWELYLKWDEIERLGISSRSLI